MINVPISIQIPVGNGPTYGTAKDRMIIPSKSAVPNSLVKYAIPITNTDTEKIKRSDVNNEYSKINLYGIITSTGMTNQYTLMVLCLTSSMLKKINMPNMNSSRYNELG